MHTHIHTVRFVLNPLASAVPAQGVPRTPIPCAVRAPCGQPDQQRASVRHWLGSTILGPAPGILPSGIRFSLGVKQWGGRNPPTQLLQPSSLGAGWGGKGQPGILASGPGLPPGSLKTSGKNPSFCGQDGLEQCGGGTGARGTWALSPGFLLRGPLSSLSDTK